MCVRSCIEVHLLGKVYRVTSFTSERVGMFGVVKDHNTVLRMKYLQIRHGYQFTNLNRNCILNLPYVFMLDYVNQTDVFQMIILLWVFGFSHLCCWTLPVFKLLYNPVVRRYPKMYVSGYEYFIFLGRVISPSAKPPFLEDQFVSLSLASRLGLSSLGGYTRNI